VTTDDAARIEFDLSCRSCGYVLRGVAVEDACPECGAPASSSLRDDLLVFAPARVRRRLRAGASILLVTLGAGAAVQLTGGAALLLESYGVATGLMRTLYDALAVIIGIIPVGAAAGVWVATPREHAAAARGRARVVARWASVAAALVALPILPLPVIPWTIGGAIDRILRGLATVAFLVYARGIARRLPDERLGRRCRDLLILFAISWSANLAWMIRWRIAGEPPPPLAVAASVVLSGLALAYLAFAALILVRMRRRLNAIEEMIAPVPRPVALVRLAPAREQAPEH
jgi:hypothetical protein